MHRWLLLLTLAGCPVGETAEPDTAVVDPDCTDDDEDGSPARSCGGDDCDDADPDVFPGAPERCNGRDDDCDGETLWEDGDECADCEAAGWFAALVAAAPEDRRDTIQARLENVRCDYSTATRQMFTQLDKDAGRVTGVYTGQQVEVGTEKPDPNTMNTEHTWPQSEGADRPPAKCDLHHLYPTMSTANTARGSLPFGEVDTDIRWSEGGSKASATHFEPRDVHKGNVARAMLYFSLRYETELDPDQRALFLQWSEADPVTTGDLNRSATIARWQGSPNPFVVCAMADDDLAR